MHPVVRTYLFPLLLLSSLLLGGLFGFFFGEQTPYIKPLGDIFLNLILTAIVPLIFFSIATAVSRVGSLKKLGHIFSSMALVFLLTGIMAALLSILVLELFPIGYNIDPSLFTSSKPTHIFLADKLVSIFTVPEFIKLFSHENMLALIIFSLLVGLAVSSTEDKNQTFARFLQAGEQIFMRVISLIMYYAPIGFFAYFANLVHELGPKIMQNYLRVAIIYYVLAVGYFVIMYSLYAYLAGKKTGVKRFWGNVFLPSITAIATGSVIN